MLVLGAVILCKTVLLGVKHITEFKCQKFKCACCLAVENNSRITSRACFDILLLIEKIVRIFSEMFSLSSQPVFSFFLSETSYQLLDTCKNVKDVSVLWQINVSSVLFIFYNSVWNRNGFHLHVVLETKFGSTVHVILWPILLSTEKEGLQLGQRVLKL